MLSVENIITIAFFIGMFSMMLMVCFIAIDLITGRDMDTYIDKTFYAGFFSLVFCFVAPIVTIFI